MTKSIYILVNENGDITHLADCRMEADDLTSYEIPIENVELKDGENPLDEGIAFVYKDGKLKQCEELKLRYNQINTSVKTEQNYHDNIECLTRRIELMEEIINERKES